MVASALLLVEVLVQVPFVGPSVLQAVMGTIALVLGGLARAQAYRLLGPHVTRGASGAARPAGDPHHDVGGRGEVVAVERPSAPGAAAARRGVPLPARVA